MTSLTDTPLAEVIASSSPTLVEETLSTKLSVSSTSLSTNLSVSSTEESPLAQSINDETSNSSSSIIDELCSGRLLISSRVFSGFGSGEKLSSTTKSRSSLVGKLTSVKNSRFSFLMGGAPSILGHVVNALYHIVGYA